MPNPNCPHFSECKLKDLPKGALIKLGVKEGVSCMCEVCDQNYAINRRVSERRKQERRKNGNLTKYS